MFVLRFFLGGVSSEGFLLVAVSATAGGREVVGKEELKEERCQIGTACRSHNKRLMLGLRLRMASMVCVLYLMGS
jgi:hypothetical protein